MAKFFGSFNENKIVILAFFLIKLIKTECGDNQLFLFLVISNLDFRLSNGLDIDEQFYQDVVKWVILNDNSLTTARFNT